ncbi:uncharacterized protein NEPG_01391 [Nematocida parisii ERTm1]|uniref:uncharacterized protein n=1 Tax=Nematocida parisii (strain ERTm1 / ATCC PRA-289) TaxID=881290 RepID=UPI000264B65C|nr:uncharacterized protein NEPG_01391 [Nematocida parisii ERTm1]EIJ93819.1 hypothetical protein NEPG_01391 [Nematocida parisii ERTm1]|eukprot:XP_013059219.1 hypothetical protein NEPG_01391 [Nematocida parisii ERTm1]
MNNSMIIKLLVMMYTICARVELSDIKIIENTKIISKEGNLVINPDGSLGPLRADIMRKCEYIHNKRLYAYEINTMHKLIKTYENGETVYEYERKPVKDKAYDDIYDPKKFKAKNDYFLRFHTHLINMFPCADGALSIIAGRLDAPTSFLKKEEVEPQSMNILAVLFLLSEQVDIPITIKEEKGKEKLILTSVNGKTAYIDQSLVLYVNKKNSEEKIKTYHTETVKLINFMKRYAGDAITYIKKEGYTEPATYEQFMEGKFLSTVQFLIQSYIYEFIDTKENYIKFVNAVYTILNDQIVNDNKSISKIKKSHTKEYLTSALYKKVYGQIKSTTLRLFAILRIQ